MSEMRKKESESPQLNQFVDQSLKNAPRHCAKDSGLVDLATDRLTTAFIQVRSCTIRANRSSPRAKRSVGLS